MTSKLNLGGGRKWKSPGWLNLDSAASPAFHFVYDCRFPCERESQEIVYSSHLLEHLPIVVVHNVLNEIRRVLKCGNSLVIKIPDFNNVLSNWRSGNKRYFGKLGMNKVVSTWGSKDVIDNIDNRCSMMFCGFWNEEYGDHFSKGIKEDPDAYHGPVPMAEEELKKLLFTNSPYLISSTLRKLALKHGNITFNHQTAWSRKEFVDLIKNHGFSVEMNLDYILNKYASVPGILTQKEISLYLVGRKD